MNNNNGKVSPETDIVSWVCGELAPQQAHAAKLAAAGNPTVAQEADDLRTAFAALASATSNNPEPADNGFATSLRHRWEGELTADHVDNRPAPCPARPTARWRRWLRVAIAPLAAAAVLAAFLAWPGGGKHLSPSLAWADVVSALKQVEHFHVTAFEERPRAVNGPKLYRMDMFYQQPNKLRLQGLDRVQFMTDGKIAAAYDVTSRSFLPADRIKRSPLAGFTAQFQRDGLLPAVIAFVFQGNPPSAEPVKSADAAPTPGIEVFDYARNARNQWARVWVAKESRLPIRLKVFRPASDGFMLVEFDYSDQQPPAFFDSEAFKEGLKKIDGGNAQRVYLIGAKPVDGQLPQGSSQIPGLKTPFKAPVGKEARASTNGDIAVVTTNPTNYGQQGTLDVTLENVRDTWGNEYLWVTCMTRIRWGDDGIKIAFFTPKGDFRTGTGERRLTMDLFVEDYVEKERQRKKWSVGKIALIVPPADDAKMPKEAARYLTTQWKIEAFWSSLDSAKCSLTEKKAALERWARIDPGSLLVKLWRVALLREAKEVDKAWELFQREALNDCLRLEVFMESYRYRYALANYIFYLYSQGKDKQAEQVVERLNGLQNDAAKDQKMWARSYRYIFEGHSDILCRAMLISDRIKKFDAGPKPTVGQVVAGKDGFVAVEIKTPDLPDWVKKEAPADHSFSRPIYYWTYLTLVKGATNHSGYLPASQSIWMLVKDAQPTFFAEGKVPMTQPPYLCEALRPWTLKIDVPAPTVDSAKDWMQDKAKVPKEGR